jgi:lambda family phage portal protein
MIETLATLTRSLAETDLHAPPQAGAVWFQQRSSPSIGAYNGASSQDAALATWSTSSGSPDADLLGDQRTLVDRTRDLIRNDGIAAGAKRTLGSKVVGTGFRLSADPDWRALGETFEWKKAWAPQIEAIWRQATHSTYIDKRQMCNIHGLTRQVQDSIIDAGESLAVCYYEKSPFATFGLRVQIIDPDRLVNPAGQRNDERFRNGIERDKYGKPVAYWIADSHPGDRYFSWTAQSQTVKRVPARTPWGRPIVLHTFDIDRPEQSRGVSQFTSALAPFKILGKFTDAELKAAVVNAYVAMTIETPLDSATVSSMFDGGYDGMVKAGQQAYGRARMSPAMIMKLNPGDIAKSHNPGRPNPAFEPFVKTFYMMIGAALGLPVEVLLNNWSDSNYSSAKAALGELWQVVAQSRQLLAEGFLTPLLEMVIEEAIDLKLIEAEDFYRDRHLYSRARWIGPGRGFLDPLKEADAQKVRLQTTSTLEIECAEQGLDWQEVLEQRAFEQERRKELGLPDDKPVQPGTAYPSDEPEDPAQEQAA